MRASSSAGPQDLLFPGSDQPAQPSAREPPARLAGTLLARAPRAGEGGHRPVRQPLPVGAAEPRPHHPSCPSGVNPADVLAEDRRARSARRDRQVRGGGVAVRRRDGRFRGPRPNPESDGVLIRNVDNDVFDDADRRAPRRADRLLRRRRARKPPREHGERRGRRLAVAPRRGRAGRRTAAPGDPVSSRAEFTTLKAKGLLTDVTVDPPRHGARTTRLRGDAGSADDPRPTVSGTVAAPSSSGLRSRTCSSTGRRRTCTRRSPKGVLISLGTDWTPSGSRTLLRRS